METPVRWPGPNRLNNALYERGITAIFCALLAAVLGGVYLLARTGFDNPVQPVLAAVTVSWGFTVVPFVLYALLNRTGSGDWYRSEGFLTLILLILAACAGLLARNGSSLLPVFEILAVAAMLYALAAVWGRCTFRRKILFTAFTAAYGAWVASVEWANGFLNPLFVENLVLYGGERHIDTLFHMSVANMVGTYGTPSIGWDGVPQITYHFGSAWLFARLAALTGMTVVQFFQLGVPVILIPLCLRAILLLAAEIREHARPMVWPSDGGGWFLVFFLLAAATTGFLPGSALHAAGVWSIGPFLSESHVLAIALALTVIAVAVAFAKHRVPLREISGNASTYGFFFVFVPLSVAAAGIVKVSQMLLLLALGFFVVLRLRLYRRAPVIVSGILTIVLSFVSYRTVVWSGLNEGVEFLSFLRSEIPLAWWPLFPVLHLVWTWTYAYVRLRSEHASTLADIRALFFARKIVDVELVVGVALVGLLPGMLFKLRGDAYYFSDFQRWFALSMLLGNLFLVTAILQKRDLWPIFRLRGTASLRIERLVVSAAAACVMLIMGLTVVTWTRSLIRSNLDTRRQLQDAVAIRPAGSLGGSLMQMVFHPLSAERREMARGQLGNLRNAAAFRHALQSSQRYSLVNTLLRIGQLPVSERERALVYVDPRLGIFWNFIPYPGTCEYSVMIGPALAGTALLDGVPAGCNLNGFYGTEAYREKPASRADVAVPTAQLCKAADERGYKEVIRLFAGDNSSVISERISCPGLSTG